LIAVAVRRRNYVLQQIARFDLDQFVDPLNADVSSFPAAVVCRTLKSVIVRAQTTSALGTLNQIFVAKKQVAAGRIGVRGQHLNTHLVAVPSKKTEH